LKVLVLTLRENLQELFRYTTGGPNQPASPTSVLLAELKPEDFVPGPPRVREESLRTPEQYEARFQQLIEAGFAWLNMSCCGVFRGHALVTIEYPRNVARAKGRTSVNFSGPPRLVADAGWAHLPT
jgi:hypothetical protein